MTRKKTGGRPLRLPEKTTIAVSPGTKRQLRALLDKDALPIYDYVISYLLRSYRKQNKRQIP
jgi:hypothetical protein